MPWRRKQQPTPIFLPGKSHRQRSLASYSPWECTRVVCDLATKQQVIDYYEKHYSLLSCEETVSRWIAFCFALVLVFSSLVDMLSRWLGQRYIKYKRIILFKNHTLLHNSEYIKKHWLVHIKGVNLYDMNYISVKLLPKKCHIKKNHDMWPFNGKSLTKNFSKWSSWH